MPTDSLLGFVLGSLLMAQPGQFSVVHGAGLGLALGASSEGADGLGGHSGNEGITPRYVLKGAPDQRLSAGWAEHLSDPFRLAVKAYTERLVFPTGFGSLRKSASTSEHSRSAGRADVKAVWSPPAKKPFCGCGSLGRKLDNLSEVINGLHGVDVFHEQRISANASACQAIGKDSRYISAL